MAEERRLGALCSLFTADVVVLGIVTAVDTTTVPYASWVREVPAVMRTRGEPIIDLFNVHLDVTEVLKGRWDQAVPFDFAISLHDHDLGHTYAVGDTVIVSCEYRSYMLGGSYTVRSDCGRFVRRGGSWVHQRGGREFALDEIRQMLWEETDVRYFTQAADVIAIVEMAGPLEQDTVLTGPKGSICQVWRVPTQVERVLKGQVDGESLVFRTGRGDYWPSWRGKHPSYDKVEGDTVQWTGRWILFLKYGPVGLYPMGGANGMLRIDGKKLIYANRVEHAYSMEALEALIAAEVE